MLPKELPSIGQQITEKNYPTETNLFHFSYLTLKKMSLHIVIIFQLLQQIHRPYWTYFNPMSDAIGSDFIIHIKLKSSWLGIRC